MLVRIPLRYLMRNVLLLLLLQLLLHLTLVLILHRILCVLHVGRGEGSLVESPLVVAASAHAGPRVFVLHPQGPAEELDVPEELHGEGDALRVVELDEAERLLALRLPVRGNAYAGDGTRLRGQSKSALPDLSTNIALTYIDEEFEESLLVDLIGEAADP